MNLHHREYRRIYYVTQLMRFLPIKEQTDFKEENWYLTHVEIYSRSTICSKNESQLHYQLYVGCRILPSKSYAMIRRMEPIRYPRKRAVKIIMESYISFVWEFQVNSNFIPKKQFSTNSNFIILRKIPNAPRWYLQFLSLSQMNAPCFGDSWNNNQQFTVAAPILSISFGCTSPCSSLRHPNRNLLLTLHRKQRSRIGVTHQCIIPKEYFELALNSHFNLANPH